MGLLGSKEKANKSPEEESPKEAQRKNIELLGREFSIVKDGLDPEEVLEFLEASAGSSEAAFKHLEQFSAFQSVARTMDESIREAKQLAEQAKSKAKIEADREKAKAIVEIQQQSTAILDETMRSCIASIEGIHSVTLDAVARTEEIQCEAFQKTKEMVTNNMAEIQQKIQAIVNGEYQKVELDTGENEDTLELSVEPDTIVFETTEDEEADEEPIFDLANLQESLTNLELSLSSLNESKPTFEPMLETKVNILEREEDEEVQVETGEIEQEEQSDDAESRYDIPEDSQDTGHQYSGEVMVQIVGGAEESWMQELRKQMLELPGARIRAESGVDEKTTMVSLSLSEPIRLFPILLSLPKVNRVVPGRLNGAKSGKLKLWPKSQKNSKQNLITVELHCNGNVESAIAESDDEPIAAS